MLKLNLGCGRNIRRGWLNLDINKGKGVDVVHDLNDLPLPFEDNKFDIVLCKDILEHIKYMPLVKDIYRILKVGGLLKIRVPHFTSKLNYDDPTHINRFSIRTFSYFVKEKKYSYSRDITLFSTIKSKIIIEKFNNIFLKAIIKIFERWVNKSAKNQNTYESSFLRVFPARNLEVILIK